MIISNIIVGVLILGSKTYMTMNIIIIILMVIIIIIAMQCIHQPLITIIMMRVITVMISQRWYMVTMTKVINLLEDNQYARAVSMK